MTLVIGTLCLNEMEHLPKLYEQHKNWPGLVQWVFVESADRVYAQTNPDLVSKEGLSVDGTTQYLQKLAKEDKRVMHIPYGFCSHKTNPAEGKIVARQQYMNVANQLAPKSVFVLDADEYYTVDAQRMILWKMSNAFSSYRSFCFRQRHIWRPASIVEQPLFQYEVVGGYWKVPHCRGWRWEPGLCYKSNHNYLEDGRGRGLNRQMKRYYMNDDMPQCVHLGFASTLQMRKAKNNYYVARGEGKSDGRQMYVNCRKMFELWQPNEPLPHGAQVVPYTGPIPEVFSHADVNA